MKQFLLFVLAFWLICILSVNANTQSALCTPSTLTLTDDTTTVTATSGFDQYIWIENGYLKDTTTNNVYTRLLLQSKVYVIATDTSGCSLTASTTNYSFSPCNVSAHLDDSIGGGGGIASYANAILGTDLVRQDSLIYIGTAHELYDDHGGVIVAVKRANGWVKKENITLGTLYVNYPIPYGTIGENVAVHDDLLFISHENATIFDSSTTIDRQGLVYTYRRFGNTWSVIDTTMAAAYGGLFGRDLSAGNSKLAVASKGGVWIFDVFDSTTSYSQHIDVPAENVQIHNDLLIVGKADTASVGQLRFYEKDSSGLFILSDSLSYSDSYVGDNFGETFHLKDSFLVVPMINHTINTDTNAGKVIVYKNTPSGWTSIQELISPMPSMHFGSSVAVNGDHIFIGENGADSNHLFQQADTNIGAVYHFKKVGSFYEFNQRLNSPDFMTKNGLFGKTILLEDSMVFIADALRNNGSFTQTQAIFVYDVDSVDGNKETHLDVSICTGDSVQLDTGTYKTTGVYSHLYTSQYGCDSNVVLNLKVNPNYQFDTTKVICANDSFLFESVYYASTGIYTVVLSTAFGCDSIRTLNLTVNPVYDVLQIDTICESDSLLFDGLYYHASGLYSFASTTSQGCDSMYALSLTVMPVYDSLIQETICSGDSIFFSGSFYKDPGLYPFNGISQFGCDSASTLSLTVNPSYAFNTAHTMCHGDSILFYNQYLKEGGLYDTMFTTTKGCDSIYSFDLTVYPSYYDVRYDTLCAGDSTFFNGIYYKETGGYSVSKTTVDGCDSFAALQLLVVDVATPVIAPAGNSILVNLGYDRYHWFKDGVFYVTTTINYINNLDEGNYTVIGEFNGCLSDESDPLVLGINDLYFQDRSIEVFPNPSGEKVLVRSKKEMINLTLIDFMGRSVITKIDGNWTELELKVSGLSAGQYTLRVETDKGIFMRNLIVL